jgi:hypothetical protein
VIDYRRVRIADDSQEYGLSVWLASMCIGGERLVPAQTCFDGQSSPTNGSLGGKDDGVTI